MLVLLGLVVNFFRNPVRIPVQDPHALLAPCDGEVVVVEALEAQHSPTGTACRQISIFMSPLNVHVCRSPYSGRVKVCRYHPGKFLVAWNPKSSTDNEHTYLVVENGPRVVAFKQIAGALARRIKCYVKPGDGLVAGQEFGFISFGSRMDVFVPLDVEITVDLKTRTIGGQTVLGRWKPASAS
jgi:phosphatidylserine decarboxylase